MRTNNTLSFAENQVFISDILSLIRHYQQYSPLRLAILGKIISCNITMPTMEMGLEWMAQQIGCCTKTVQRFHDDMVNLSALTKEFRYHGRGREQTNRYTLHPEARSREFLELVAPYFHEIKLYLLRTARDYALSLMKKISQKVQTVKCALATMFNGGVQPFNPPFIKSNLIRNKQVNLRTCVREGSAYFSNRQEGIPKRRSMEEYLLRPLVKKISRKLVLSIAGSIPIACYPDEVLQLALGRIEKATVLNKKFYGFISICSYICKDLGMRRDTALMYQMQDHYGVADSDPKTQIECQKKGVPFKSILTLSCEESPKQVLPGAAQQPIVKAEPIRKETAAEPMTLEKAQRCINNCKKYLPEDSPARHSQIAFIIQKLTEQGIHYVEN